MIILMNVQFITTSFTHFLNFVLLLLTFIVCEKPVHLNIPWNKPCIPMENNNDRINCFCNYFTQHIFMGNKKFNRSLKLKNTGSAGLR